VPRPVVDIDLGVVLDPNGNHGTYVLEPAREDD
jgi:hypothetical protein